MSSIKITLRLKPEEYAMLQQLTSTDRATGSNPSEFFRSCLYREFNKGKTCHIPSIVYSEMRNGRPKS